MDYINADGEEVSHVLQPIETRLRSSTNPLLSPESTDIPIGNEAESAVAIDPGEPSGAYRRGRTNSLLPAVLEDRAFELPVSQQLDTSSLRSHEDSTTVDSAGAAIGVRLRSGSMLLDDPNEVTDAFGGLELTTLQSSPSTTGSAAGALSVTGIPAAEHDDAHAHSHSRPWWDQERLLVYFKRFLSTCLTLVYLIFILWGIVTAQVPMPGPPVVHLLLFLLCMVLLCYLEGLKNAILALEKDPPESRRLTHPRAYKLMTYVTQGNNLERFLVGRQFATVFVMTLIAVLTSFPDIQHLGFSPIFWFLFVQTGLPGATVATTIGSLHPQLLVASDPWQFLDMRGSFSVLSFCLGAELTGVGTHSAWLLLELLRRTVFVSDLPIKPAAELSPSGQILEGAKYVVSSAVLLSATAFILYGIGTGQALLPLPVVVVFIILVLCFVWLGVLEGLQVALLVSEDVELETVRVSHPRAHALMKKAFQGKNLRKFLIGRQFFVVWIVFLVSQCTIFPGMPHMGMSPVTWLLVVQLGFPTAIAVLCFSQLPVQLLAIQDPMLFMSRPGCALTLDACLVMESTGLDSCCWVAASVSKATWFRTARGVLVAPPAGDLSD